MGGEDGLARVCRSFSIRWRTQRAPVVLQGTIGRRDGKVCGEDWHVFLETADFDTAWASMPRPGIVVTEREIREDPVLEPLIEEWRSGDDSAYRRFRNRVLESTEDEAEPN
jgi:hypothetical protein